MLRTILQNHRTRLLLLSVAWFLLDRLVKNWIQSHLTPAASIAIMPGVFHITHVYNTGAAFSMLQQHPGLLLIITSILFLGLLAYSLRKSVMPPVERIGLSLVLGGALGNIGDRLMFGKVVDYLDVVIIHYPVFNLADSFIFIGVCLLLLHYLRQPSSAAS